MWSDKFKIREYMQQEKSVNRWFIVKVALMGAFCGTLFAVAYCIVAYGIAII
jgi:hypothetical protein